MNVHVDLLVKNKKWKLCKSINKNFIKKLVKNILSLFPNFIKVKTLDISVLLTDTNEIMILNEKFREKNKATNVLSFPDIELNWQDLPNFIPEENLYLGDIAFCFEIIEEEAQKDNKDFFEHFAHLLTHSILHLIGFDHKTDEEANIMEKYEHIILNNLSIKSPHYFK